MKGRLFFIEAVDGAGKTTQIDMLKESLGDDFVFYREPGGTPNAEEIRKAIFNTAITASSTTKALLFAAARSDLYERIEKDINNGKNVICDRSFLSTVVYQGHDTFLNTNKFVFDKIMRLNPKFILIDIDEETFKERMALRSGIHDALEEDVINNFNKYRNAYKESLKINNYIAYHSVIIPGNCSKEKLHKTIKLSMGI